MLAADILSGRFHRGDDAERLEAALASLLGVKHAILTPTARLGIYLSILNVIKPGQKVILSPITIVDVINMVICAGGVPVFADVEPNTCNIAAAEVERLIDKNTGAVFITHLHGLACDVRKIKAICETHGVPLIEDAAQAFSTKVDRKWVGTFGKAGVFSFGMYKLVNAFFGGMIVTDDDELNARVRTQMKDYPMMTLNQYGAKVMHALTTDISTSPLLFSTFTFWVFRYGYLNDMAAVNGMVTVDRVPVRKDSIPQSYLVRMTPSQARLIYPQLDGVEANNRARIKRAKIYDERLRDVKELVLPPFREDGTHIYTYYPFRCPDRHAVVRHAMKKNRDLVISHYHNCASLDIFKQFYRACPNAQATADQLLYLPTYPRYTELEAGRTADVIRSFFVR